MTASDRSAVIVTVGNEIVSGDVENTNASWLARRLASLGVPVTLVAAVRDDVDEIAAFLRLESPRAAYVFVTGGLGGTPDDITREAVAAAVEVDREPVAELARELRARFASDPEYAARWAELPHGSRPLPNPLGGAPGFVLENVFVLPGLPAEMEAMFETLEDELRGDRPIASWRRRYRARESEIVGPLAEAAERWPNVLVGSYPSFPRSGPEVEVVVKSGDPDELAAASRWLEAALAGQTG